MRSPSHFPLRAAAAVLLLGAWLAAGCVTPGQKSVTTAALPPVTSPGGTGILHPGKFVWMDLVTPDAEAARRFYSGLFGWSFRGRGAFDEVFNGTRRIACIIPVEPKPDKKALAQWLPSLSVSNVDAAAEEVRAAGGKILKGPVDMPRRGRGALVSDMDGARLVLLRAKDGDPEDREPGIGDWLWVEDWTTRPDRAVDLYKALGEYESILQGGDYTVLVNEGKWRAGIRRIKEEDFSGRWVPVVRVEDPGMLTGKVEDLGGHVWIEPGESQASPDTALISDNAGALLILQRWTFAAEGEAP